MLDANGKGIAGVTVSVQGLGLTAQTNTAGTYLISGVPEGTHKVIAGVANPKDSGKTGVYSLSTSNGRLTFKRNGVTVPYKDALENLNAMSVFGTATGSVQAVVKRGVTVTVAPITLLPETANLTNLVIHQADPSPADATLPVDQDVKMQFDVAYAVGNLTGTAAVYVCYPDGQNLRIIKGWEDATVTGSGELVIGGMVRIPDQTTIQVVGAVLNNAGNIIAISYLRPYAVSGGTKARAPILRLESADFTGVKLTWLGGNTTSEFKAWYINRESPIGNKTIAAITDKSVTSFVDNDPIEGYESTYSVYLADGSTGLTTNQVTVNIPATTIFRYSVEKDKGPVLLDPDRNYIYMLARLQDRLIRYNLNMVPQGSVPVCSKPDQMKFSSDKAQLIVTCSVSDSVALIDLHSFTSTSTRVINGIPSPEVAAFAPGNKKAYVGSTSHGLYVLDLDTGDFSVPTPNVYYGTIYKLTANPDGQTLYLSSSNNPLVALSTADLSLSFTYNVPSSGKLVLSPDGERIYLGNEIYDGKSPNRIGSLGDLVVSDINADGTILIGNESNNSTILVYQYMNGVWTEIDRITNISSWPYYSYKYIGINADNSKAILVYGNDYENIAVIDLAQRALARSRQGVH